jgi:uncharacterized membrane protein
MKKAAFSVDQIIKFLLAVFLLVTALLVLIFMSGYGEQMLNSLAEFFSFRGI